MAVGYGSSTTTGANDAFVSSINVPIPSGVVAGNHVYVVLEQWESTNPTVTMPSGFELLGQLVVGSQKLKVFVKQATGPEGPGNYTFSWTGSQWTLGHAVRVTGAKAANNPTGANFNTASASSANIPNTSVTVGFIPGLLHFVANENAATQTTPPTNFTEVQDANYLHSNHRMTAAASGTFTAPNGVLSTSTTVLAMLVAIEPTAGGGTPVEVAMGRATESDAANTLAPRKHLPLPQALETTTSRTLAPSKLSILTRAFEFDVANGLVPSKLISFDRAVEVDEGRTLTVGTPVLVALGRAVETNVAQDLTLTKHLPLQRATESDLGLLLNKSTLWTLERAEETESANSLTVAKQALLQHAVENDLARPMGPTPFQVVPLGRAIETTIAHEFGATKFALLPRAEELDISQVLDVHKVVILARAIEFDIAREVEPPDTGLPLVDDGAGEVLVASSRGEIVSMVKVDSGLVVVTVVADRGERP